jgi:hypothetical protein
MGPALFDCCNLLRSRRFNYYREHTRCWRRGICPFGLENHATVHDWLVLFRDFYEYYVLLLFLVLVLDACSYVSYNDNPY